MLWFDLHKTLQIIMKKYFILFLFVIYPFLIFSQNHETIYALNHGVTTKQVIKGKEIVFGQTKPFPNASYIKIKKKPDNSYHIETTINGKFAYGHYFKYKGKVNEQFEYLRTDGNEIEYIITNYPLDELALSNKHDEKVNLQLINYRTSFAILFKF